LAQIQRFLVSHGVKLKPVELKTNVYFQY